MIVRQGGPKFSITDQSTRNFKIASTCNMIFGQAHPHSRWWYSYGFGDRKEINCDANLHLLKGTRI